MAVFNPLDHPICFSNPLRRAISAWWSHIPFGMFLIDLLKPKVLVELGTHHGVSYCAFCQAAKELGLDIRAYAVDTWQGDDQSGLYGPDVLADLRAFHDPLYGDFSTLIQSTFDEAVNYFVDGSIDLLHVDGYHSYEAVKHDFDTWLPKVSQRGVMLFHDINMRERDFGVWKFWEELQSEYKTFEFKHGHGLGLVVVRECPDALKPILELAGNDLLNFRDFFYQLGRRMEAEIEREINIKSINEKIIKMEENIQKLNSWIIEKEQIAETLKLQLSEKEQAIQKLSSLLVEKEQSAQELGKQAGDLGQSVMNLQLQLVEKDKKIQIARSNIQALTGRLAEKDFEIQALSMRVTENDDEIKSLSAQLTEKEQVAQALSAQLIEITNSTAWSLIKYLWKIRITFAPHGSRREKIGRFLIEKFRRAGRVIHSQNVKPIFTRTGQTLIENQNSEIANTHIPIVNDMARQQIYNGAKNLEQVIQERFAISSPLHGFLIPYEGRRLNLVTDSINSGSLFGGVATAIVFSSLLAERWGCDLRVVTRTEKATKDNFRRVLEANGINFSKNVEFLFAQCSDSKAEIPIGDGDLFLTTSWWTTKSVKETFGEKRILYILQEDERAFYPYGDEYLQCNELLKSKGLKFIINTKLLYDHFVSEGFENIKENGLWFEPSWPQNLFYYERRNMPQKSNFFFYARPNNIRNLFYLGLEVINTALDRGVINPNEWDFYFVGKDIPELRISNSYYPKIYQNLNLADYADLVRNMDLGLCLMFSPHPSYPPLDLAASGAVVVTNRYGMKQNLDNYSKNILCFDMDVNHLVEGIRLGIELSNNTELRVKNYNENNINRDWRTSFQHVLDKLEKWPTDV